MVENVHDGSLLITPHSQRGTESSKVPERGLDGLHWSQVTVTGSITVAREGSLSRWLLTFGPCDCREGSIFQKKGLLS